MYFTEGTVEILGEEEIALLANNDFSHLESLELSGATDNATLISEVTYIPKEIGLLSKLRNLSIYNLCFLEELPKEIGQLTNLKYLYIRQSNLSSLPATIGNLVNLEKLDLSENENLTKLPEEIGNCIKLKSLKLAKCKIDSLPKGFYKLPKLKITGISNKLRADFKQNRSFPSTISF